MNARALPLLEPVQCRPEYDNTCVGHELAWIEANIVRLLDWYTLGSETCGTSAELSDFGLFARSQHELMLARREDSRRTAEAFDGAF